MRPLCEVAPVYDADEGGSGGKAQCWHLGNLGDMSFGEQLTKRRRGQYDRNGGQGCLFLQIFSGGGTHAIHDVKRATPANLPAKSGRSRA